jgi:hypothetical protein
MSPCSCIDLVRTSVIACLKKRVNKSVFQKYIDGNEEKKSWKQTPIGLFYRRKKNNENKAKP